MKQKLFFSEVLIAMLSAACAPLNAPPRPDLLGDPAPMSAATRKIVITPDTRHVNVTGGEIVTFVVGDKAFAWNFIGTRYIAPFDLSIAVPQGVLDHAVMAYVALDARYMGAGGHGGHGGGHGGK
jgi:Heavy-metal resistance protein CzcE